MPPKLILKKVRYALEIIFQKVICPRNYFSEWYAREIISPRVICPRNYFSKSDMPAKSILQKCKMPTKLLFKKCETKESYHQLELLNPLKNNKLRCMNNSRYQIGKILLALIATSDCIFAIYRWNKLTALSTTKCPPYYLKNLKLINAITT